MPEIRPKIVYKKETYYQFIIRADIPKTALSIDAYYAMTPNNKLVYIKGPYTTKDRIKALCNNTNWKQKNGISHVPFIIESLIPDRWPEGVPIGIRNTLDCSKRAYFIIFDSPIEIDTLPRTTMRSRKWSKTEIIDWNAIRFYYQYAISTEQQQLDYMHAILFRYVLGISNLSNDNFIMIGDRTISINEETEGESINFHTELSPAKIEYVHDWLELYYDELDLQWEVAEERLSYLKQIQTKESCLALFKRVTNTIK